MSKKPRREVQDELDAEARYFASLKAAQVHADELARDDAYSVSQRVAAEHAAEGLRKIEAARVAAAAQPTPEAAKTTFMQQLKSWWGAA